MSMVRPATLFILIAILVLETHDFLKHYNLKRSLIEMRHKASPFLLGYFLTFLLQYSSSGNWTTYLDAAKSWEGGLKSFNTITDWSVEGFGLSIFALCFVSVPILFYLLTLVKKRPDELTFSFREGESSDPKDSLTIISCLYLSGIFLFTLLTSGGNLHGFFRFTLCSPLFYVLLLMAIHHVAINRAWKYHLGIFLSAILFFIVLDQIAYGGSRTTFSLIGPLLYLAYFIYLSLPMRTSALRIISLFILIACSIVWNSYLLNILLSNGYIYT